MPDGQDFAACPSRDLVGELADRWSIVVLCTLDGAPLRFNEIRRRVEGVSQKSLTQTLRRLERNGLVSRRVIDAAPVGVEYALTDLGRSLLGPFREIHRWTCANIEAVAAARAAYDARR